MVRKKAAALRPPKGMKRAIGLECFLFLGIFLLFFVLIGLKMGAANMLQTMMNTAYDLLMSTVFYIMALAVLAGAISALFAEFGVISLLNKILSPLMRPLFGLPGASVLGVVTTYLSDNPAVLTLAEDAGFRRYFKKYQLPALTNLGTSFGMGLIITTYILGVQSPTGESFLGPALIGNLGAVVGAIISTRLMLRYTKKRFGTEAACNAETDQADDIRLRKVREGSVGSRFIDALLSGGKSGVSMGVAIIPGVLIICTLVMMLTYGPGEGGVYTGTAYEGVAVLPWIGEKLSFLLEPLFGFRSSAGIAVPITALGAAGAAIGLIPGLVSGGLAGGNDIAVFTAMCMCWSGYLSTHVAMMDSLKYSELTGRAILYHTIGGICAGVSANLLYKLFFVIL